VSQSHARDSDFECECQSRKVSPLVTAFMQNISVTIVVSCRQCCNLRPGSMVLSSGKDYSSDRTPNSFRQWHRNGSPITEREPPKITSEVSHDSAFEPVVQQESSLSSNKNHLCRPTGIISVVQQELPLSSKKNNLYPKNRRRKQRLRAARSAGTHWDVWSALRF
jgi:hypothetical protein